MRVVEMLPERLQGLAKELAKFGSIGVINFAINMAVFNGFMALSPGHEVWAKAIAVIIAATSAYFLNRHWTYRDRPKSTLRREYTLFFVFNAVGFAIETGLVLFTKYGLHNTHALAMNISSLVGIALGTIFRFWAYRTHVFKITENIDAVPLPMQVVGAAADALPSQELAAADELAEDAHGTRVGAAGGDLAGVPAVASAPSPQRVVMTTRADGTVILKVVDDLAMDDLDLATIVALADRPAKTPA